MGLFKKVRELTGDPSGHLLKSGTAGWARVTRAKETGVYSGVGNDPVITFTLEVTIPGRPSYEVSHRQYVPHLALSRAAPGSLVAVKVDPDDSEFVAIDWSSPLPPEARAGSTSSVDFTGAPEQAEPLLAPGATEVDGLGGAKLGFDGEQIMVCASGYSRFAPLASLRKIEKHEEDAGYLRVTLEPADKMALILSFKPGQREAAEALLAEIEQRRKEVDPATAAAAGGSG
jgi:hypothetical protein